MKKLDNTGLSYGNQMLLMLLVLFAMMFIFADVGIRTWVAQALHTVFYPLIGFHGQYPLLTIILSGIIVVFLSSFFTHLFTNWKAMGKSQEINKAFQKELSKARREGNTNRMQKLMKMQPQIMKMTMDSSSGMMKPMIFLVIFIAPLFIWLTYFLGTLQYYSVTVPWASDVSLFNRSPLYITNWFLLYLVFSFLVGQLFRQTFKWISWSERWQQLKKTLFPKSHVKQP
ncbi:MAG: EMC3/TMCO1 family protein [Candidatus Thermoplasmatota archaeon]